MKITAKVENSKDNHQVTLQTNDNVHSIVIPPKSTGYGSSANGGELLFLALATCYCNDLYREAAKRNIQVERVEVEVDTVAEIQNTLRVVTPVMLSQVEGIRA